MVIEERFKRLHVILQLVCKHNRKRHKSEIDLADEFGRMYLKVGKDRTAVYFAIKAVLEEEPGPAWAVLAFETAVEQELDWMTEIPTHANAQKFFPGLVGEKSYYGSSRVRYMKVPHLAPDLKNMREKLLGNFALMKERF
ncbi:MAG: hypothetical protein MJY68_04140 [Bacteroidaceae bacterium]|nr:hypothetical protein [Bacteroidaceae bacterium]